MALIVEWLTAESRWIAPSIVLAAGTALWQLRGGNPIGHRRAAAAMSMYAGVLIGTLAFGHLFAVSLELSMGTLDGSLARLYGLGVVLLVPAALVIRHARRLRTGEADPGRSTAIVNGTLAGALLLTGPLNFPLAVPALLNAGHAYAARPRVAFAIVAVACIVATALFVGSVPFFLSGGSFEEFSGM